MAVSNTPAAHFRDRWLSHAISSCHGSGRCCPICAVSIARPFATWDCRSWKTSVSETTFACAVRCGLPGRSPAAHGERHLGLAPLGHAGLPGGVLHSVSRQSRHAADCRSPKMGNGLGRRHQLRPSTYRADAQRIRCDTAVVSLRRSAREVLIIDF